MKSVIMRMLTLLRAVMPHTRRKGELSRMVALWWVIGASVVSGCSGQCMTHHGHYILPKELAKCQPSVSTQDNVREILGSPTVVNAYDPYTWYYLTQSSQHLPTKKSAMVKRSCYAMQFSRQGVLQGITSSSPMVAFVPDPAQTPLPSQYKENKLTQVFSALKEGNFMLLPQ
jgi:outer membrane protein assembly factor BamE (lipoprotein component of BamABCDE complex)